MRSHILKIVRLIVIFLVFCRTLVPARALANSTPNAGSNFQLTSEVVPLDIRFGEGKAVLKRGPHNGPVLNRLKQVLRQSPLVHVEIEGNPDPWGTPSANRELSRQRAEALRDTLVELYRIPPGRIQVHPAGETTAASQKKIVSQKDGPVPIYLILYRLQPIPAPAQDRTL